MLNHQKVSKYYEHNCLQSFFLIFEFLLTALIVKTSPTGWNLLYLSKKRPRPNLKGFQYQIWNSVKRSESSYQVRQILAIFLKLVAQILG